MKLSNSLKKCSKCKQLKTFDNFRKDKKRKDGLTCSCKKCWKKYYKINCKKIKKRNKKWVKNNSAKVKLIKQRWVENNLDRKRKSSRIWARKNKKRIKKYYEKNHKIILEYHKKYYKINREKLLKEQKIYSQTKRGKDVSRKARLKWIKSSPGKHNILKQCLKRNVSSLIRIRLKKRLSNKDNKSTFDFLPYTIDELIKHLESRFQPEMTWNNHGLYGWHIDHIKPDCLFHYTSVKDPEFQKCWALENLQPLWAKDNWRKSNKILKNLIK